MKQLFLLTLLISTLGMGHSVADTLRIPVGDQGTAYQISMPQRGDSQAEVRRLYGEPIRRHATVGNPPITRWDYLEFAVYFEHQTVINSVKQHQAR